MTFEPISIDEFIKLHLKSNPSENAKELRKQINSALAAYKKGVKCACGSDIWVIGSAFVGNACFTCITGESDTSEDFEIREAIIKNSVNKKSSYLASMSGISFQDLVNTGIEDEPDENFEPNTTWCSTCIHDENKNKKLLCELDRFNPDVDKDFFCFGYEKFPF